MTEQNACFQQWSDIEVKLQDHWTCLKPLRGYTTSLEDVKKVINIYERCTNTSYIYQKQDKHFGNREKVKDLETCRVFFKDREGDKDVIGDDGVPFFSLGSMVLACHLGTDKHKKEKEEKKEKDDQKANEDHAFLKKRKYVQDTKKRGCKANIYVKEVLKFPQFKLLSDSRDERNANITKVKESHETGTKRFYILLPSLDAHTEYHSTSKEATLFNPIHPMIRDKIHALVGEGVSRVSEMRRHLNILRKTALSDEPQHPGDRRYFPTNRDIRNHIYCTVVKNRYSKIDQVNLKYKIDEWRKEFPDDHFKYRSCKRESGKAFTDDDADDLHHLKESLLFCHQTSWQKRLLARYGNEICFLDATYRTTRYSIPLFFIVVKTNVGYTVVGSFAVQNETKEAIKEALEQFRDWNKDWTPRYFLTDFSEVEIQALEDVFLGCFVYLCDFHREQAWVRWMTATKNGCSKHKDTVLIMMRRIARAPSVERYHEAVKAFKDSHEWIQSSQLQKWYTNQWEPVHKRWVWAFRKDRLNCKLNTNNGIERQNRTFKHNYLSGFKNNSLSGMLEVMISVFLPEKYQEYIKSNVKANDDFGKIYNKSIPEYLRNRPKFFVVHCMNKLNAADNEEVVLANEDGSFNIRSYTDNKKVYRTTLNEDGMPLCECVDWQISHFPCKHMMSLIRKQHCSWMDFAEDYIRSPMFVLDMDTSSRPSESRCTETGMHQQMVKTKEEDIPKRSKKGLIKIKESCRELLSTIRDLTFLYDKEDDLIDLEKMLFKAKEKLETHVSSEEGLALYPKDLPTRKRPNRQRTSLSLKRTKKEPIENNSVVQKFKAYTNTLTREDWLHIRHSELTSIGGRRAAAVLEKEPASEDEMLDLVMKSVPFEIEDRQLVDFVFKITANLVEKGIVGIEHDPATTDKEADIAMKDLVSALASGDCKSTPDLLLEELTTPHATTPVPQADSRYHVCSDLLLEELTTPHATTPVPQADSRYHVCSDLLLEELTTPHATTPVPQADSRYHVCSDLLLEELTTPHATTPVPQADSRYLVCSDLLLEELTTPHATTPVPQADSRYHVCGEVLEATDFRSVLKQNWLTDKVINAFMKITMMAKNKDNSCHIYVLPSYLGVLWDRGSFDTWLYKKVHLSLFEWVFLPVNVNNNHWTLLVGHVPSKTVSFLDSMPNGRGQAYIQKWRTFMSKRAEVVDELDSWREGDLKSERQQDGHSCGLYVLLNAMVLVRGQPLETVTRVHVGAMRDYVYHTLIEHTTSPPSQLSRCDMLECSKPGASRWVCCDVCGRWCHNLCVDISANLKADFVCPICNAQYE